MANANNVTYRTTTKCDEGDCMWYNKEVKKCAVTVISENFTNKNDGGNEDA